MAEKRKVAGVVVLGDIGRSPRMQYHSLSLANQANCEVHIVAYQETQPREELLQNENIKIHKIKPFPAINRKFFLLYAPFKLLFQFFQLFFTLLFVLPSNTDLILTQNPPSMPVLSIVWLVRIYYKIFRWRKLYWIIDWHNFGYTILQLSYSPRHPIIRIAYWYEKFFGKKADYHICVTSAMKDHFSFPPWSISARVMHDTPPSFFHRCTEEEKHNLFLSLSPVLPPAAPPANPSASFTHFTYQTAQNGNDHHDINLIDHAQVRYCERDDRPRVVVSSTSWTPDEDFSVMLSAIQLLDDLISLSLLPFPPFYFFITGKGPQKEHYENLIAHLPLKHSKIFTLWLTAEQYPLLLGSADMGISMHTSSSGLDLPMKVVDMFGCKLPVLAVHFDCLNELVRDGENGCVFKTSEQLAQLLFDLFKDKHLLRIKEMRENISMKSWAENWADCFLPIFDDTPLRISLKKVQ